MKFTLLIFITLLTISSAFAQAKKDAPKLSDDQFINVVEQSLALYYADYAQKSGGNYDSIIAALNYDDGQVVEFSDEVYCQRLKEMNKLVEDLFLCEISKLLFSWSVMNLLFLLFDFL